MKSLMLWVLMSVFLTGCGHTQVDQNEKNKIVDMLPSSARQLPPCPGKNSAVWTNCIGMITSQDGGRFIGEFRDGQRNGYAVTTYSDGKLQFIGEFRDGNSEGDGTYNHENGDSYKGKFRQGKPNGYGTYLAADGSKYFGDFKDGLPDGRGTHEFHYGDKYVGEWKRGDFHGVGTYIFKNGSSYEGEWRYGERSGKGIFISPNHFKYVGTWRFDRPNGQGTETTADGVTRTGLWADGIFIKVVVTTNNVSNRSPSSLAEQAKLGDAEAQFQYGMTFIIGAPDELKPRVAIEWLMKAAAQGHSSAKKQVASMYDLGIRISRMP